MLSFETAMAVGDRVENPERNVPRATMIGTLLAGLIYLLLLFGGDAAAAAPRRWPARTRRSGIFFATFVDPAVGADHRRLRRDRRDWARSTASSWCRPRCRSRWRGNGCSRPGSPASTGSKMPYRIHIFSSGLATLLVLANYARSLAGLFRFMMLVTTSVTLIFYCVGTLAALWLDGGAAAAGLGGLRLIALARRRLLPLGLLRRRHRGERCGAWHDRRGDAGLSRHALDAARQRAGGESSRVSGMIRLSFCAKLLRQTSLSPERPRPVIG